MQENLLSSENAHTDYPSYLADEQRRKVLETYEGIKKQIKEPKEETKRLQLQIGGV